MFNVGASGSFGDHQAVGDLAIGQPLRHKYGHFVLTLSERRRRTPARSSAGQLRPMLFRLGHGGSYGLIDGHGSALGPGVVKREFAHGRSGGCEAGVSLVARHQVEEGPQRAKPRPFGFVAGSEQTDAEGIVGLVDLDLSDEAEPVGEARAASFAQKCDALRQEQAQPCAVSPLAHDMRQS